MGHELNNRQTVTQKWNNRESLVGLDYGRYGISMGLIEYGSMGVCGYEYGYGSMTKMVFDTTSSSSFQL